MAALDPVIIRPIAERVLDPEHDDAVKGQLMRLADIFLLGPYMIWSARGVSHTYLRTGMTLLGIGTIIYNANNLLRIYRAQRGEGIPELASAQDPRGLRAPSLRELDRYNVNLGRTPRHPRERPVW